MDYYEICERKLKYLNYSSRTAKLYLHYISKFLDDVKVPPTRLSSKDFQVYLDNYSFTSVSQQNQVINAIRFLYKYGLDKKYDKVSFKRPRKEKKIPRVVDKEMLVEKINAVKNKKHKAILALGFSVGLRVSEVVNLKIVDIDSKRMLIHVKNAKGRKDRMVPLSGYVLEILREYFKEYKPVEYLFNGQSELRYSARSCNQIVKKYIGTDVHYHTLRHSSFTSMLESGVDIRLIQKIAGHQNIKTTEIYTHVSSKTLSKVALPM